MKFDPFSTNLSVIYTLLHRSYEASKKQFWNDTEVLDKLIEKYGKPELEENYRRSLLNIFSVIYYGEIVAMIVSAQLLDMVEHFDAKKVLAAQVIEEAKHATAFQRYLSYLGDIPQPNKYTKKILLDIMNTKLLSLKLLGMQLLVENIAFYLFTAVKDTAKDPILKELLRYVSIDEAK
ncbi:MAG: ferritin-like domain-containing protein, partial [bacterium]|nr:ferritin-like domain-containing protein [bacterium]